MLRRRTLRGLGLLCRGNEGLAMRSSATIKLAARVASGALSSSIRSFACSTSSSSRSFHASASSSSSGIKEFIPKWMRRGEGEELPPEEILSIATKDGLSLARKSSDKFKADYYPPEDLIEKIEEICRQVLPTDSSSSYPSLSFPNDHVKFLFLDKCVETFQKRIPNSFVDDLSCVGDVVDFFSRPRLARDKLLERMRDNVEESTPKNVHLIPDYMTFEKEMELHQGRDAFPHQDIIVSSLREKGKYKSVRKPKCPWEEAQGFDLPVRYGRHKGF